jgi:hypothetical protein
MVRSEGVKNIVKKAIRDEKGAALILAIILLLVGGLIVAPLLAYMGTGILTGEVYDTRTAELYAADAGVEDAVWKIQNSVDEVKELYCGAGNHTWTYPEAGDPAMVVNGKSVEVTMAYVNNTTYRVVSTATRDGSSTAVEAYLELELFDLLSGALVSKSDINFSKNCTVAGDVYYVGEITGSDYTHTEGKEMQIPLSVFPTQQQNEAFARQFREKAMAGQNHTGDMDIVSDTVLNSTYISGNLNIKKEVKLTINGVVYVKGSVNVDKGVNDYNLMGSGSLIAEGNIDLRKVSGFGAAGDSILMSLNGDITFKKEATINAFVYAPNGDFAIDKNITVFGGLIGNNIDIKKDGSFTYVAKASSFGFPILVPSGAEIKTYNISQN